MKKNVILGIDPGASGGFTLLEINGKPIESIKMPDTAHDINSCLAKYAKEYNCVCYMEKVGGMPGNGGSRAFNFGKLFGYVEMALICNGIKTISVTPQKWQKEFQLGTKSGCASNTEWKNKLKAKAQQLFPMFKITLANSDSVLIAEYGRTILHSQK